MERIMDMRADKPVEPRREDGGLEGWARIIMRSGEQARRGAASPVSTLSTGALFDLYNKVEAELQRRNELG
jgi:hypothetical protein